MERWTISICACAGALILCWIGGAVLGAVVWWETPFANFFAAFGGISMALVSAPRNPKIFAGAFLVAGCVSAWLVFHDWFYPEHIESLAYQPTLLPVYAAWLGGLLAYSFGVWPRPNKALKTRMPSAPLS